MAGTRRTYYGPYRTKRLEEEFHVVERIDNTSDNWQELRPRVSYRSARQAAIRTTTRLNRRWQKENEGNEELLAYWRSATN